MIRLVILLAAITPPLLILSYGIAKARGSWGSEAIWNAFLLGAVGAIAAVPCEFALDYLLPLGRMTPVDGAVSKAIFIAGLPEEAIKFFVLVYLAETHVDVRRVQDILVLALAVSLGFATLENLLFVVTAGDWKMIAALRAITSVPGHGLDGLAMGALLMAARVDPQHKPELIKCALLVPVILHAAYDFPLFAIHNGIAKVWFGAVWLGVIALSSVFVIKLCNRILPDAVAVDQAAGRDQTSKETTERLITGGAIAIIGGPLLAGAAVYARGLDIAAAATVLSIFPIALGIDSILTGLRRKQVRLAMNDPNPDSAR
jgi:RsiW-degrading membrane proteinase PrsW (M82 family)